MIKQGKDKFYDSFLKVPTKDNFREFIKNNCGELDELDFKAKWIDKGHLAKTILAMANSRGGIIAVGIKEESDGTINPIGISEFKDKADINNEISKYIPPELCYEILNYNYDASEYEAVQNKKFQLLVVHDTPDKLPFISLNETSALEKDTIYIRRGTKCEKATASEIDSLLSCKIDTIFKETSDLSLEEHLQQLKILYNELPKKIKVLIKKGSENPQFQSFCNAISMFNATFFTEPNQYEEIDNPSYPEESYEAFIERMIQLKKLKIEKCLDLK